MVTRVNPSRPAIPFRKRHHDQLFTVTLVILPRVELTANAGNKTEFQSAQ